MSSCHVRKPACSVPLTCFLAMATLPLSGCLVAGYSSGSGFWMWPGSIVVTIVLVLLFLLLRR